MRSILFILVLMLANAGFGQEAMTFQDCMNLAMQNNLDLKTAYNKEESASYQYKASYGKLLPAITGEVDNRDYWEDKLVVKTKSSKYVNNDRKIYRETLNAQFNLFSGFKAINTIRLDKEDKKISELNVQKLKNEITIDLAQKFITILYLQEIIVANEAQIQSSGKQLDMVNLKFNSGVISESEVFKIKSQKATEELVLQNNQNHLSDNLISLKQLMNIPLEKEIILVKPNLELSENVAFAESDYAIAHKAVDLHPAYSMSLLKEQRERTALSIARSIRYPVLSMRLMLRSTFTDNPLLEPTHTQLDNNYSKQLRLKLTIPLFSQFEDFAKIKTGKLNYQQSKLDTEITRNALSKEVLKAITDAKTSIKKKESSAIAFEFSKKSYDADALKFELGKININELNITKMMYNTAQAELIQSKYELLFNNALIRFYLGDAFLL